MLSLFRYLKPYSKSIVLILVLTMTGIFLELLLPTLMANVVDEGIVNDDIPYILQTGMWMIVCSIFAVLITIAVMYVSSRVSLGFGRDLRSKLFVKVEHFSLQEFDKIGPASLITRTTNDIRQVQEVTHMMLRMMVRAPLMLVGGIIMAVSRDATLSLVFLAALPILAGFIFVLSRRTIPLFRSLQKKTDRLNLLIRESLIGVRVVRAFNRVNYEKNRFNQANTDFRDTGIKVNRMLAVMFPIMMIIMNFTNIAIIWFGSIRLDAGLMQVGNLMAFLQYAMMILFSLVMLSMAFVMVPRAQASAVRINEVLDLQSSMQEVEGQAEDQALSGHIEFKNVGFRYEGAEKAALENISFVVNTGQTTAIIGSTGAGKTTLLQMITRFYDAEEGAVLVNGINVKEMSVKELRNKIGYVPQRATLFTGTLEENVKFGEKNASEAEVRAALNTAQAIEFVEAHEQGLQRDIEQAGANLSGGQKQRLSIARALVKNPEILLFDDSFSALDYKTDASLRMALKRDATHATKIIVAQRISTVQDADQIIVLNEGQIAGIGTHDELLRNNKIYQEIKASQQTEEESA